MTLAGLNDAGLVGGTEGLEQVVGHVAHLLGRQRADRCDVLGERVPGHQLHDDPRSAVLLDDVTDGHDVGVVAQLGGVTGLPLNPGQPVGPLGVGDGRR
jgi:hypothetical protein